MTQIIIKNIRTVFVSFSIVLIGLIGCSSQSIATTMKDNISIFIEMENFEMDGSYQFKEAIGIAFIELGISPKDVRILSGLSTNKNPNLFDKLVSFSIDTGDETLLIEPSLRLKSNSRYTPSLKIIKFPSGEVIANVSSLDIQFTKALDDFHIAAVSLAVHATKQLQEHTRNSGVFRTMPWMQGEQNLKLIIENFNACSQQAILETIESEFPGFVDLKLIKSPHPNYAEYIYITSAKTQRLIKWLYIFFLENRLVAGEDFVILNQKQEIRMIKEIKNDTSILCLPM